MVEMYCNNAVEMNTMSEISEEETNELHYSEIDSFKLPKNNMTRKDPEYAEVQRSEKKRHVDSVQQQEELYTQVKRK